MSVVKPSIILAGTSFVMSLLFPNLLKGQETETYTDMWFLLLNHVEINDRWQLGNELHFRRTNVFKDREQFIVRPFVTYQTRQSVGFTVGYTYSKSYPYQENGLQKTKPEHDIWEQVVLKHSIGSWDFFHRYRIEHRFQGHFIHNGNEVLQDGYEFSNRFRYRITLKHKIISRTFIHLFDEIWARTNGSLSHGGFDRNWLYAGIGYNVFDHANVQLAYLHQYLKYSDNYYQIHPTVQLTLQYEFLKN